SREGARERVIDSESRRIGETLQRNTEEPEMKRPIKWLLVVIVLIVAAVAAIPLLVSTGFVRDKITDVANRSLAAPVKLGGLSLSYSGDVAITQFSIGNPPGFPQDSAFLAFDRSSGGISFLPLLGGRIEMKEWRLEHPEVAVYRDKSG